ncbi:hypothetical protein FXO38_20914 [Capsicum annuum]|nr:hypothetical protein FXO38_20914 [Capsicum annuum]
MTIREKKVNFGTEWINKVYGLPNADIEQFYEKSCEPEIWMAYILCPGKEVPWATTKRDILMNDFTAEARLWMNIICSRVLPCTHMNIIKDMRDRMVELCKRAQVEKYATDTWVLTGPRIFSLKFRGEGAPGLSKKKKKDSGQIREVRDLVSSFPQGPGKPSTAHHSSMSQSDYDI